MHKDVFMPSRALDSGLRPLISGLFSLKEEAEIGGVVVFSSFSMNRKTLNIVRESVPFSFL